VSPFGYGKVLYLRMDDGRYSVYAHLQKFIPALESLIYAQQRKANRYTVEIFPAANKYRFKKGDLIAYTGDTGIGYPHLHFEIRDSENRPENPLAYYPPLQDTVAPVPTSLAVIPLRDSAYVNWSALPQTISLNTSGRGIYSPQDTIYICGPQHLAFRAYDRADGVPNRYSVYAYSLAVDDSVYLHAQMDKFSYAQSKYIELDRNFRLWRLGQGRYQMLARHPLNRLPFYRGSENGLTLSLRPGEQVKVRLDLFDYNDNKSQIVAHFRGLSSAIAELSAVSRGANYYSMQSAAWQNFAELQVISQKSRRPLPLLRTDRQGKWLLLFETDKEYLFSLRADRHMPSLPLHVNMQSDLQTMPSEIEITKSILRGTLQSQTGFHPQTTVTIISNGDTSQTLLRFNGSEASWQHELAAIDQFVQVQISDGLAVREVFSRQLYFVTLQSGREIRQGSLVMQFPARAFYDPAFIHWSIEKANDDENLRLVSPMYNVQPFLQPIQFAPTIGIKVPTNSKNTERCGLFYLAKKGRWQFLAASEDNIAKSKVFSLETFVLAVDTLVPEITPITLSGNKEYRRLPETFVWRVSDRGSGFRDDRSFACMVDSVTLFLEYDPEEQLLRLPGKLLDSRPGSYTVTIRATDNLTNTATISNTFRLR
jgi:hypothetical protein